MLNCLLLYFFNIFFIVFSDHPDLSALRRPVCGAKVRIFVLSVAVSYGMLSIRCLLSTP